MKIVNVSIPDYIFDSNNNPFSHDAKPTRVFDSIAASLDSVIQKIIGDEVVLVRGLQSGHFEVTREELIHLIEQNDGDSLISALTKDEMFAALYSDQTVSAILKGFHVYKPKSEERPQLPVDVWMLFALNDFVNIEYLHPRHNVIARDKWKRKEGINNSLIAVIVVN